MINNFNLQDLFERVQQEATELKKRLTPEEIAKLDSVNIKNTEDQCVYGQLTGNCSSERAFDLMQDCCLKVYTVHRMDTEERKQGKEWLTLNGSPKEKERRGKYNYDYFSPIESLLALVDEEQVGTIFTPPENIKNLIAYLKGETEELILTEEGMYLPKTEDNDPLTNP